MDDGLGKIKVFPDHFGAATPTPTENCNNFGAATPTPTENCIQKNLPISHPRTDHSLRSRGRSRTQRKIVRAASMLKLFSLRRLQWGSSTDDKIELSAAEVESLRSEIADLEDKEAHLKAQLEHLDEILRSARLAGYLDIRTRWTELPGEPPIDDTDVDDWLPRFVVLHGSCIFFYLISTDLSPQDSTLLSDVVEVGQLPSFRREEEQILYAFYILTCHGLRFECSSPSKVQVDSWLTALQIDCKLGIDKTEPKGLSNS